VLNFRIRNRSIFVVVVVVVVVVRPARAAKAPLLNATAALGVFAPASDAARIVAMFALNMCDGKKKKKKLNFWGKSKK